MNTAGLLTIGEVAARVPVSVSTVTARARAGKVPGAIKFRGCWYIPEARLTDGTFSETAQGWPKGKARGVLPNRRGRFSQPK